ncbi:hypothetical protein BCR41DRAFT_393058 [Lobosporangium transversale]|uniref:Uncharacterized protein n=1 Tax=Lobosporangium transversale TaxID=64571 RepID=A0A1Y2GXL3_9FUNG|nr:hypothetical protein BCR41DRAFT_393058 [Lobosporangium transversale]ORZ27038.1 hypothetical protein BCR41DRAFT_393058 [Lobosporangium transversale]|eukprot:XP_021884785.1 hypothetical protein BCR41DRAFT_393058 [Lobosporangium transversale]
MFPSISMRLSPTSGYCSILWILGDYLDSDDRLSGRHCTQKKLSSRHLRGRSPNLSAWRSVVPPSFNLLSLVQLRAIAGVSSD